MNYPREIVLLEVAAWTPDIVNSIGEQLRVLLPDTQVSHSVARRMWRNGHDKADPLLILCVIRDKWRAVIGSSRVSELPSGVRKVLLALPQHQCLMDGRG